LRKISTPFTFCFQLFFILILGNSILISQEINGIDSLNNSISQDTSTIPDRETKSELEGPVKYSAEKITFSINGKKSYLEGDVQIEYLNMQLEAGRVAIDWEKNLMKATGIVDTTDSLGNPVYKDLPIFREKGNEPIYGEELEYNFKTQRGKVLSGRTSMPPGYYQGEEIKKIGKNTLLVRNGYFTSCDSIYDPHFYYKSYKMRIIPGKRAVAKPIIMYIEDVPVLAVPFAVFPMESGRRSGIIIPGVRNTSYGGRSVNNFGYYWAASVYWDATILANFFEKTGMAYEAELRYNKRYLLNGYIRGQFAPKDVTTGELTKRWSINFRHNQTINETTSFNAAGSLVSDEKFRQDYSHNQQDRLNQLLTTDANFQKRWPSSKNSFSASISRTENLNTGELDITLPRLSFNHTQTNIFPYNASSSGKRKWYHDLFYNYNSNFTSRKSKDFNQTDNSYINRGSTGWQHAGSISLNSKVFKYMKLNQSLQIQELWVPEYLEHSFNESTNKVEVADTIQQFKARHTFSYNFGASTTTYGLFEIPFTPLKVIRHKMDPIISFSFSPDFTDPQYGYVQTFTDTSGREIKADRFTNNPFSRTTSAESRRVNITLNNLFQGKIIKNGEEKKIDLFNINFGTAYDFLKDSINWSDLSTNFRARASKDFDFNISTTHTFYKATSDGRRRSNNFVWENGLAGPRLLNFQLNARLHLAPPVSKEKKKIDTDSLAMVDTMSVPMIGRDPITEGLKTFSLPWDITANFSYNYNKTDLNNISKRFDTNIAARLEITKNWRIQYTASIDLLNKELNYQSFNIYRDLHCWEMSFSWGPNPQGYSFFSFEIHVKERALQDFKLTKSSGGRRVF